MEEGVAATLERGAGRPSKACHGNHVARAKSVQVDQRKLRRRVESQASDKTGGVSLSSSPPGSLAVHRS